MSALPYSIDELKERLSGPGCQLSVGPFVVHVNSSIPSVGETLNLLYSEISPGSNENFADFHISVERPLNHRRWLHPQVNFSLDGHIPFKPLPLEQAFPLFEWGLNWCIGSYAHQYLIVHAAVIEKNGKAALFPAPPGSGKSTLCAGLMNRGWRLLSDELALISPKDLSVTPIPRPVSLKNESIEVMQKFSPDAIFGPIVCDTSKGTVTHMKASEESVARKSILARPEWIIFPKYEASAPAKLVQRPKGHSFMEIAEQSFNYNILGLRGFETLKQLIDDCDCYDFSYGMLDDAVEIFDALSSSNRYSVSP